MKKLLFLFCFMLSCSVYADTGKTLLNRLSDQAKAITSMQGTFTQTKHLGILPKPILSSGRFSFHRNREVVWQTLDPIVSTLKFGADGIKVDQGNSSNTVTKNNMATTLLTHLITGNFRQMEELFDITAKGSPKRWQLTLKPRDNNLKAFINEVRISGGAYSDQIFIEEPNGDTTQIKLAATDVKRKSSTPSP